VLAAGALALAGLALLRTRGFTLARLMREVAETGLSSAEALLICALAGMIIGVLTTTGLGFTLSLVLLEIGRTSLFLLLVVTAIVSLILGMGMPTTGVYLLLATLAAPALVQLGIPALAAHMFVFYFGMLSMITPPVALAAFAAASIARAPYMAVSVEAVRLGWVAFLVPFLFVYQPAVLAIGSATEVALVVIACAVAVPLVTAALVGHALAPLSTMARIVSLALGLMILWPTGALPGGLWTEMVGIALGIAVMALHIRRRPQNFAG
jgi:TRAP-type uncharacterized transport system fused permease subunit